MKHSGLLFQYEFKKILCKKSTWITFTILIILYLLSEFLVWNVVYTTTGSKPASAGTIAEEHETETYTETYGKKCAREKKAALSLSGRDLDDSLLEEVRQKNSQLEKEMETMSMQEWTEETTRYQMVYSAISSMTGENYDFSGSISQQELYKKRELQIREKWMDFQLTEQEKAYWQEKEDALTKPFTLQYFQGYEYLVSTQGIYMAFMLVSFFIAIVVSHVFSEEHVRKMDQLILCSRFGRNQLYFAKIWAGIAFTFVSAMILTGLMTGVNFFLYGAEGFSAVVQQMVGWYSDSLTLGQLVLLLIGIEFLASVLTSVITMVLSERFRSSIFAMAMVIGLLFAARLIPIPRSFRLLSQVWNLIPINLLKIDEGFLDLRLVSVFGIKMTSWQFAPILYLVLGILLIFIGKRIYCNYQVRGR